MRFIVCFIFIQLFYGDGFAQLSFRSNDSSISILFAKSDLCSNSNLFTSKRTLKNQFKGHWVTLNSNSFNAFANKKQPNRSFLVTNSEREKASTNAFDFSYKASVSFVPVLLYLPISKNLEYNSFKDKIHERTYISSALFLSSAVSGYWLSNSHTPSSTFLLTVHKLTSISNLVLLDVTAYQKNKEYGLGPKEKLAMITMNLCFVSTIATGGLLSTGKDMPRMVHTAHSITPWITIVSSGIMLYLMNNYK